MKQMITETDIRNRVGERSFSRGKRYFREGAIINMRQAGNALRARCLGSAPSPYHLWVQLGDQGIVVADCSCPVGDGGYCKHIAALLFTWINDPDSFQEAEPLETALTKRGKDDLVLLIRQMIARYPDLEELIDLFPAGSANPAKAASAELIRRQVQHALRSDDYEYDIHRAAAGIASKLEGIMDQADSYRETGAWTDAATVYCTVLTELRDAQANIYDHDGELNRVHWAGSVRLGECLTQIEQPEERLNILRTLVEIIAHDIELGGYGFSDDAYDIVLDQATPEEAAQIISWIEEKIDGTQPGEFSDNWRLEAYGGLLLDLHEDTLSDELFIELCRRTHRLLDLVNRLLQLNEINKAVSTANGASDYELLSLADLFVTHGHEQLAEELVWERAGRSNDTRLDSWLQERAVARQDWQRAIEYASNLFRRRPSLDSYRDIEEIAQHLGDWPERRKHIVLDLAERGNYALLTRIHLNEKNVSGALETLAQGRYAGELAMEVARLAEEDHPREAIHIYGKNVDHLIATRHRSSYAQAAVYLTRIKQLYEKLEEPALWQDTIMALRNHKPRLPALLDELKRAEL